MLSKSAIDLEGLEKQLEGKLFYDHTMRLLYATDASAYKEMPLAVAIPKTKEDIRKIIAFARANNSSVIPRAAGPSLAGQVVGNGIIVDISQCKGGSVQLGLYQTSKQLQQMGVVSGYDMTFEAAITKTMMNKFHSAFLPRTT